MFRHGVFIACPGLSGVGEQFPCGTGTVWSQGKVPAPLQEPVQPERPRGLAKHLNFLWDSVATAREREHLRSKCAVPVLPVSLPWDDSSGRSGGGHGSAPSAQHPLPLPWPTPAFPFSVDTVDADGNAG